MNTDRRNFLLSTGAIAAAPLLGGWMGTAFAATAEVPAPWQGYAQAIIIDALGGPGQYGTDPAASLTAAMLDDVRKSGLTAVNVTVSGVGSYSHDYDTTIANIAYWNDQIARHPDRLMLVRRGSDLTLAKSSGRLGLIYGFQDTTPLFEDINRIAEFGQFGVRIIQLTYNVRNLVGDGCMEPGDAGLSRHGVKVVEKLNDQRVLIDLSHSGRRTALEAIAASKVPVAITHTGCAALARLPRNKTDVELKALADKGGVAGIYLMPFLREQGQPMAADVVAHVEHAIKVCGEDHVGIGSDGSISPTPFTDEFRKTFAAEVAKRKALGIAAVGERPDVYTFIPDLNRADRYALIGGMLKQRGHSDERIGKVLGGNFARLFGDVFAA